MAPIEDSSGQDVRFLADNLTKFMAAARQRPEIASLSTTFLPSVPQQFEGFVERSCGVAGIARVFNIAGVP